MYDRYVCACLVTQLCPTLYNPWTVAHQAPLSIGFLRQEHQSGLLFPPPGDLSYPETELPSPVSSALQADSLPVDCLIRYALQAHLISGDKSDLQLMKSHFPFPAIEEGKTFTKGNLCPVFRQNGRKLCFLCLLFLNSLQLKIFFLGFPRWCWGFLGGSDGRESAYNAGDLGWISELGRHAGGGHGNPLQYSCLENPMDRGAWQAIVHRVTKSWT